MNEPQKGEIYRHFKYDPNGEDNNYTYEIIGISIHTETGEKFVTYKPLYELDMLKNNNCDFCIRPLEMFMEDVDRDGCKGPRFVKVN